MITPRHLASRSVSVRPIPGPIRRRIRRHGSRHQMMTLALRRSPTPAPTLINLWLDDRRALPLKWGLLVLMLLGVALLEGPL